MHMFKNILVAVDGSWYSREALPVAIVMAKKFDATLLVVHVAEHDRGRAAAYVIESPAEQTKLVADAVKQAHDAGVKARGELVDRAAGHVAGAIADAAARNGAQLIVMGSRGLSDAAGVFLGSVTHKVMQLVEIPVLVARPHGAETQPAEAGLAAATS
jgi:nucleotide-binding universal stress UspA family protein